MDSSAVRMYAQAIGKLAADEKKTEQLLEEATAIREVLTENPKWSSFLKNPGIAAEEKISVTRQIFEGRISRQMVSFLCVAIKNRRSGQLPAIMEEVIRHIRQCQGRGSAEVTSAAELKPSQKKAVRQTLERAFGYRTLDISYAVDPELIGGLKIRMNDRLIDSTIKNRLERMEAELLKVSPEQKAN